MTELENKIKTLKEGISGYEDWLKDARQKLKKLESSKEITNSELYDQIKDIVSIDVKQGKYKHVLGGDGRSMPWNETIEGQVATVSTKEGIFITSEQKEIIKDYVNRTCDADHIEYK